MLWMHARYATKEEKASQTSKQLLNEALRRMAAKDVDEDEESAVRIFASYLVQQVGGRDWSAQEVSHVNMGLRTVWGSHGFNQKSLVMVSRLRNNITPISDEAARAGLRQHFRYETEEAADSRRRFVTQNRLTCHPTRTADCGRVGRLQKIGPS